MRQGERLLKSSPLPPARTVQKNGLSYHQKRPGARRGGLLPLCEGTGYGIRHRAVRSSRYASQHRRDPDCGLHAPYLHSAQSGQCRDAELPTVRHCNPGGTDCPRELSSQRRPSLLEHDRSSCGWSSLVTGFKSICITIIGKCTSHTYLN